MSSPHTQPRQLKLIPAWTTAARTNARDPLAPIAAIRPHDDVNDRRAHKRFGVQRPGKVFRRAARQYAPAVSRDLSLGGALLEVESDRPLNVGEVLDVAVALTPAAVVPSAALVRGVVVRSIACGEHRQLVAVRYDQQHPMTAAA